VAPGAVSGSCNFDGSPFQLPVDTPNGEAPPIAITSPLIVGGSSGAPSLALSLEYYGNLQIHGILPRSAPISATVLFSIKVDSNTSASGGGIAVPLRNIFNFAGAVCRMDRCSAVGCSSPGPSCRCGSGSRTPGNAKGRLELFNDTLLKCNVSSTAISSDGLYVMALSLNGQDYFLASDSTAVLFFKVPRFVDATPPPGDSQFQRGRKNFGIFSGDILDKGPAWGFSAAASSGGGSSLVAFFVEPSCSVCAMRLDEFSSCPAASDVNCRGRSANPSIRFVPGRCLLSEPCTCEDSPYTRTASLSYAGIQHSYRTGVQRNFTVLNGTVPGPGESGKLGVHYVCFSVDGSNYAPVVPQVSFLVWRSFISFLKRYEPCRF
jgi:hypothetical protein